MSHFASKALSVWSSDDVVAWLDSLSLGMLGPAFKHNGVTGPDLLSLTSEDLVGSLGCTPFQAKKIVGEVQRLAMGVGSPFESASAPPAGYPPPAAYPPPPAAARSAPGMNAYPSQPYGSQPMAAPYGSQPMAAPPPMTPPYGGSQPMAVPYGGSQPVTPSYGGSQPGTPPMGSMEVEKLRQDLEREKLKNDLRQEINTQTRLAAVEQANKGGGSGSVVVQQTTVAQQQQAAPTYVVPVAYERYCGPISLIIGFCIFPCICFCPVDQRPVTAGVVMPAVRTW